MLYDIHYMKYIYLIAFLLLGIASKSQTFNKKIEINDEALLHNLQVLSHDSLQGRFFGTAGNQKAQIYIADQFDSLRIESLLVSGYIQKFPYTFKNEFRQEVYPVSEADIDISRVPDTTVTGGNVLAIIRGETDRNIIITAHLDHLGIQDGRIFNGADDNASGVAALISIAAYFKNKSPKHNLILAAVDAEEIGSLGAEYLLENFPFPLNTIALNINMDMIAHNDVMQLYASGLFHHPQLKEPLEKLNTLNPDLLYGHDIPGNREEDDWTFSSDHRIFHHYKIPFIYFGVEDHEDYHQSTDTFENINESFYVNAVKLIIEAVESYDTYLYSGIKN